MKPIFGCIADDYTGASDIASQLAEQGVRTVQLFGAPDTLAPQNLDAEAIIIGLKTRTVAPAAAVKESLIALDFLKQLGCQRYYFKYCSTFDSTPEGNIGAVADALADQLDTDAVIFCPAFPQNGRTVYQGHLFVNGVLLSESSLASHPLTPMTDSNLVRWLDQQTPNSVGLLSVDTLEAGRTVAKQSLDASLSNGKCRFIADALNDTHLEELGVVCADFKLVTGGSALAPALVKAWRNQGLMGPASNSHVRLPEVSGHAVILSGSCSEKSNRQVANWQAGGGATYFLDPAALMASDSAVDEALHWISAHIDQEPVLVYATSDVSEVSNLQSRYGRGELGHQIEQAFVSIARHVIQNNVQTLIVAGGETSSAVVAGLDLNMLTVGPSIAPGVPWMFQDRERTLAVALKSGNFGSDCFYRDALAYLQSGGGQ